MDTKQVIARFEAERQALAMMDHPNIAKVLDGGATETGRPFFVMELVRGIKITDYCDQNNLPTNERLELFMQVCQAIQHAHQKGIIHRDIKPSNILVTQHDDVAVPKVIDFGIAKATVGQLTDKTVFTAFAQFIGTPAYMSPEQAQMSGLDVDTRADIYSLGVLLYELLTGNTPFDAKELLAAGMDEMRRKIREEEPAKPSTCLSTMQAMDLTTVARRRHVEPPKLIHLIRGDLDWLVMKCLEKDRTRRYETANALAMDLQRHLSNEPVVACPPSNLYRFQKLVRRNKLAFAATSAVVAALVIGLGVSTWMFFKEKEAHQRAVAAEQEQARLRRNAEAEVAEGRRVAKFLGTLAESLRTERNLTNSESAYRESLAMWKRLPGDEHQEVDAARNSLARVLQQQGKLAEAGLTAREAAQKCESALEQYLKLASDKNRRQESWSFAISYEALGLLFQDLGQTQEAEKAYRDSNKVWRRLVEKRLSGDEHPLVANSLQSLAIVLRDSGKPGEAEMLSREALTMRRKLLGNGHIEVGDSLNLLGELLGAQGKLTELESLLRDHPGEETTATEWTQGQFGHSLWPLGDVYLQRNQFKEAEQAYNKSLQKFKQLSVQYPTKAFYRQEQAFSLEKLSYVMERTSRLTEAEANVRSALDIYTQLAKEMPASTAYPQRAASTRRRLAEVLGAQGKRDEAEAMSRDELAMQKKLYGDVHREVDSALASLAQVLQREGKLADAEVVRREELAMEKQLSGDEHLFVANSLMGLGSVLYDQHKLAEAEAAIREALAMRKKLLGNEHADVASALSWLATVLEDQGKLVEAETTYRETLAMRRKLLGNEHPDVAAALAKLTMTLLAEKKFTEAEPVARECFDIRGKKLPDDWQTFNARSMLGGSLLGQKKYAEAEPLLLSGYEGMEQREAKISPAGKTRPKQAIQRLVQLYEATGQAEKAAEWNKKLAEFDQAEAEKKTAAPKP